MASKIKTSEEIKKELIKECMLEGVGKKPMVWKSDFNYQLLSPQATIVKDNHVFRLRYARQFNSPFLEDQDDKGQEIKLSRIQMEEFELHTNQDDICLNMFLMLAPGNVKNGGNRFWLEDKEKEAEEKLEQFELVDMAASKIRGARLEELKACLHVLSGHDTMRMQGSELKVTLRQIAEVEPERIIDAFNDKKTLVKYQYYSALMIGYINLSPDGTLLSWRDSGKQILAIPNGEIMANHFADFALSARGKSTYEALIDKLSK